ncbi:PIN/TRAM domain-containing protein [Thermus aquaticus]|uniref:Membrane-associated protein containing RNA-binding TRAM domain and ribonuclease PIN-domain n=1 Tax=Thermus aquaticus (strain ATCC BAA-2747 / Y51MC23) TaxID=498848 RepID=A0ABM5VM30_THEA5|nr:PIN domain-containing protein [Thermus aquaticus]ALJ91208.1 membrane-associated protein containing RNA-binding TRAM domain and ribonuclease PIN-domain [Thermus aquaticus Y51MC23]
MRLLLYLLFALLGYQLAVALEGLGLLPKALGLLSLNRLYLTLAGLLTGVLLAPRLEILLEKRLRKLKELPPEIPVALTLGATLGLLLATLLTTLLSQVPGFSPYHSLFLAVVLVGLFAYLALGYKDYLRPPAKRREREEGGKVLDTSVLVDGRLPEVAATGFLEGPLYVPHFVLKELQHFADSPDPLRRAKGRRGLEALERLKELLPLEVVEEAPKGESVDEKLLFLARDLGAALVTNDLALLQMARIYGVKALSVQALAQALRPQLQVGDTLKLLIFKEGKEPHQGVGYLEDGSMVVVDEGIRYKGQEIEVVITQAIQTQVGRLFFARPAQ